MWTGVSTASPKETRTGTNVPGRQTSSPVQTTGYYPTDDDLRAVPSAEAVKVFYEFAACMVVKEPKKVQSVFLDSHRWKPGAEFFPGYGRLASRCLGKHGSGQMTLKAPMLWGAWAQELYLREFSSLPPVDVVPSDLTTSADQPMAWIVVRQLAHCLVINRSAQVDALIRTPVGSASESEMFKALSAHYAGCLSNQYKLSTNRFMLRLTLADVLYRRAHGPGLPPEVKH